jgi:hypothetical protein
MTCSSSLSLSLKKSAGAQRWQVGVDGTGIACTIAGAAAAGAIVKMETTEETGTAMDVEVAEVVVDKEGVGVPACNDASGADARPASQLLYWATASWYVGIGVLCSASTGIKSVMYTNEIINTNCTYQWLPDYAT